MTSIPFFALCEHTGKYLTRRKLCEDQIIKAANAAALPFVIWTKRIVS